MTDFEGDEPTFDLSDEAIEELIEAATSGQGSFIESVDDDDEGPCPRCRSVQLACQLTLLDTRLNEQDAVAAYQARFGTSERRRVDLFRQRSEIRKELSTLMRIMHEGGMSSEELYVELPFLEREQIASLLMGEP